MAELVAAVTNPEYAADRDEYEQYREHVADSLRRYPWARVIKASDFTDNGVGLIHTTGPRLRTLAGKYAPLVPILRELIASPIRRLTLQPGSTSWASLTGPRNGSRRSCLRMRCYRAGSRASWRAGSGTRPGAPQSREASVSG